MSGGDYSEPTSNYDSETKIGITVNPFRLGSPKELFLIPPSSALPIMSFAYYSGRDSLCTDPLHFCPVRAWPCPTTQSRHICIDAYWQHLPISPCAQPYTSLAGKISPFSFHSTMIKSVSNSLIITHVVYIDFLFSWNFFLSVVLLSKNNLEVTF